MSPFWAAEGVDAYTPTAERLSHIFDIIENFLHREFILAPAAAEIRKTTPPRPKRA
jgi:hypothetical protein